MYFSGDQIKNEKGSQKAEKKTAFSCQIYSILTKTKSVIFADFVECNQEFDQIGFPVCLKSVYTAMKCCPQGYNKHQTHRLDWASPTEPLASNLILQRSLIMQQSALKTKDCSPPFYTHHIHTHCTNWVGRVNFKSGCH